MIATRTRFGPADHGVRLTLAEYEEAEYAPGFKYELIEGRLYVSPEPNFAESFLERWLSLKLNLFSLTHPAVVNYVATKGRIFLPSKLKPSVPEPDLAVYADVPLDLPIADIHWEDLTPVIIGEVLVDGDSYKDMTRNPDLFLPLKKVKEYWVLNGAEDAERPILIQHRRRGKNWGVKRFAYGETFTTPTLPGFELLIDPRQ